MFHVYFSKKHNWKVFYFYFCLKKWICHIKTSSSQVKDIADIIRNTTKGFKYEKHSHDNDYIILKLGSPLQFNENVQPACLPSSSSFLGLNSTKTLCFTSGWGKLYPSKCNTINCCCFSKRNDFSSMYFQFPCEFMTSDNYCTRPMITRSWLETALEYLPYIRTEFCEKTSLKTKKWFSKMR